MIDYNKANVKVDKIFDTYSTRYNRTPALYKIRWFVGTQELLRHWQDSAQTVGSSKANTSVQHNFSSDWKPAVVSASMNTQPGKQRKQLDKVHFPTLTQNWFILWGF